MDVVLVHLGRPVPHYVRVCAQQVEAVAGRPPLLVGPREAARLRSAKLRRFREVERLTDMGLQSFWRYSCERFFVLEEAMRQAGLDRALHIENDNLLYAAPEELAGWMADRLGPAVALCPLTDDEDTAGIMYVGSLAALSQFTDALLELVALPPAELLAEHGGPMANEMRMIHLLRVRQDLARALPTNVEAALAAGSDHVYDPASYGQWVDGTPSTPGVPYAGDHHAVGREFLANDIKLLWDAQRRRPIVQRVADGVELPLANLHIHSKRLDRWTIEAEPPPPPRTSLPVRARATVHDISGAVRRRARGRRRA
jgi:hypothetical protein